MNVTLIGMPGCGKSTCGVLAAKMLCMSFLDTDLLIQQNEGMTLQNIINAKGGEYFAAAEESAIITLYTRNCVIATGGSAVYSENAMRHLKNDGIIIYLRISCKNMKSRIRNLSSRGILLHEGETLDDLYERRAPLYERYANEIIDCDGCTIEQTVAKIIAAVKIIKRRNM